MEKDLDRLEKLKNNSIENPGKKKRGCGNCKKEKEVMVTTPPPLPYEYTVDIFVPTKEQIKEAYAELTSYGGVKEDKKEFINKVYKFLFDEDFKFNCRGCDKRQARRFTNYINSI